MLKSDSNPLVLSNLIENLKWLYRAVGVTLKVGEWKAQID